MRRLDLLGFAWMVLGNNYLRACFWCLKERGRPARVFMFRYDGGYDSHKFFKKVPETAGNNRKSPETTGVFSAKIVNPGSKIENFPGLFGLTRPDEPCRPLPTAERCQKLAPD